jgi:hypothetical protein
MTTETEERTIPSTDGETWCLVVVPSEAEGLQVFLAPVYSKDHHALGIELTDYEVCEVCHCSSAELHSYLVK